MTIRVLVTGASGFVGTRVCRHLLDAGCIVRAQVRHADPSFFVTDQIAVADIANHTDWTAALQNVDVVVHLAARAHILQEKSADPLADFRHVNVAATKALALASARAGIRRFVYMSSIGVNGTASSHAGFTEHSQPAPTTPYGVSKLEAEQALWGVQAETKLKVTVVRPPLVYGAHAKGNFALLQRLVRRRLPLPFGSTNNLRTLIGVDNLADFVLRCVTDARADGELFLIGDTESVSTKELVTRMGQAAGHPARLLPFPARLAEGAARVIGRPEMARALFGTLVVDSTKARTLLDWSPPNTLAEGLARSFQET